MYKRQVGAQGQSGTNAGQGAQGAVGAQGATGNTGAQGGTSTYAVPAGGIIIWSGAEGAIPSGWVLCNGSNSTPDLRDKFVIGAGNSYNVSATGGSKDAVLVTHTHNLQNHVHGISLTTNNPGDHDHNVDVLAEFASTHGTWQTGGGYRQVHTGGTHRKPITSDAGGHTHTVSGNTGTPATNTTDTLGESATDKNLPPYYALCYIMKT